MLPNKKKHSKMEIYHRTSLDALETVKSRTKENIWTKKHPFQRMFKSLMIRATYLMIKSSIRNIKLSTTKNAPVASKNILIVMYSSAQIALNPFIVRASKLRKQKLLNNFCVRIVMKLLKRGSWKRVWNKKILP